MQRSRAALLSLPGVLTRPYFGWKESLKFKAVGGQNPESE